MHFSSAVTLQQPNQTLKSEGLSSSSETSEDEKGVLVTACTACSH